MPCPVNKSVQPAHSEQGGSSSGKWTCTFGSLVRALHAGGLVGFRSCLGCQLLLELGIWVVPPWLGHMVKPHLTSNEGMNLRSSFYKVPKNIMFFC